ncbi:MAG: hypothetical protein U9N61_12690 [Euryarchaeota archaeon]|nr:hypothetical protein [Euryarchaeota archaeon]
MVSFFSYAATDNLRLARSKVVADPSDDSYGLIHMPRYAFVTGVWLKIITPYSAASTGAILVGVSGNGVADDNDAFLVDADIDEEAAGFYSMMNGGAAAAAQGYWFDQGSGAITTTFSIGDSTNNCTVMVFAQYSVVM